MHIIAFDPSKHTGYALRSLDRDHSAIRCGVLEMPDKADHYYTADQIGLKVRNLLTEEKKANRMPTFAILEQQALAKIGNTSADAMIYPWVATSAIVAVLSNFGIPYASIPAVTWRVSFFGRGFKPPVDSKGKKDWKKACVAECERLGIVLPPQKTIAHNASEAAAIAICAQVPTTKVHARRYEPALIALRMARNERASSNDLFGAAA